MAHNFRTIAHFLKAPRIKMVVPSLRAPNFNNRLAALLLREISSMHLGLSISPNLTMVNLTGPSAILILKTIIAKIVCTPLTKVVPRVKVVMAIGRRCKMGQCYRLRNTMMKLPLPLSPSLNKYLFPSTKICVPTSLSLFVPHKISIIMRISRIRHCGGPRRCRSSKPKGSSYPTTKT